MDFLDRVSGLTSRFAKQSMLYTKAQFISKSHDAKKALDFVKNAYQKIVQEYRTKAGKNSTAFFSISYQGTQLNRLETGCLETYSQLKKFHPFLKIPLIKSADLTNDQTMMVTSAVSKIQVSAQQMQIYQEKPKSIFGEADTYHASYDPSCEESSSDEFFVNENESTIDKKLEKKSETHSENLNTDLGDLSIPSSYEESVENCSATFAEVFTRQSDPVKKAILANTQPEMMQLGKAMSQIEQAEFMDIILTHLSRMGEALGQGLIERFTHPLGYSMAKAGVKNNTVELLAKGIQSNLQNGEGALLSVALSASLKKHSLDLCAGKINREMIAGFKQIEKNYQTSHDQFKQIKENTESSEMEAQSHFSGGKSPFENYEINSSLLSSVLEASAYVQTQSEKFEMFLLDKDVCVDEPQGSTLTEVTKNILLHSPELINSNAGFESIANALLKDSEEPSFLKQAKFLGKGRPNFHENLDHAINVSNTLLIPQLVSSQKFALIPQVFKNSSQYVTQGQLKNTYAQWAKQWEHDLPIDAFQASTQIIASLNFLENQKA